MGRTFHPWKIYNSSWRGLLSVLPALMTLARTRGIRANEKDLRKKSRCWKNDRVAKMLQNISYRPSSAWRFRGQPVENIYDLILNL